MAIPFRLRRTRAAYPRAQAWRFTTASTVQVSDSYTSSVRGIRNIRRLRGKKLRLSVPRLGQRRAKVWLTPFSVTGLSDSFQPTSAKTFKRTWRYWRAR